MERIDELTRSDIVKGVDAKTKKRAKLVKGARYVGITRDYTVHMEVPSVTANPPTKYIVKIKLVSYPDIENEEDLSVSERSRLALLSGDVAISCTCPAFKWWGYEYIMTQLTSHEGNPQTIYPHVRNPELEGTLCKHAFVVTRLLGKYWNKVASDILKNNFID